MSESGAALVPGGLESGSLFAGRYRILDNLGSGAMGRVVRVSDTRLGGQEAALKILYPHLTVNTDSLDRFRREVLITRKLLHRHIVRTHSFSTSDYGQHFISMEFIDGSSLAELIARQDKLPIQCSLRYFTEIAAAMAHAHSCGVLHRDLKPENIIISLEGSAKVADFGISELRSEASSGSVVGGTAGTPHYMSPEQLRGEALDVTADIYSFGILAFEVLCGQRPFEARTLFALAEQHFFSPLPPISEIRPDVPSWLSEMLVSCTVKKASERIQSFDELYAVLSGVVEGYEPSGYAVPEEINIAGHDRENSQPLVYAVSSEQQRVARVLVKSSMLIACLSLLLAVATSHEGTRNVCIILFLALGIYPLVIKRGVRFRLGYLAVGVLAILIFAARNNPSTWERTAALVFRIENTFNADLHPLKRLLKIPTSSHEKLIFWAIARTRPGLLRALVSGGVSVDRWNASGQHTLHIGALAGVDGILETLLDTGLDPDPRTSDGRTPLIIVAGADRPGQFGQRLLEAGADPNAVDEKGNSPLYLALDRISPVLIGLLLQSGAIPEMKLYMDGITTTALHKSALKSSPLVLRKIAIHSGDLDVQNHQGRTALHLLALTDPKHPDRQEKIDILLGKGGSVLLRDAFGKSALEYAEAQNDAQLVTALRRAAQSERTELH